MPTINGTAISWGVGGVAVTGTGIGTFYAQSIDRQRNADVEETRDEDGEMVSQAFYNKHSEATFEYVVKGSSISDAHTQVKIPEPGAIITITSSKDTGLAGTNWIVQPSPKINRSNTGKAKVTLSLKSYALITSVAS